MPGKETRGAAERPDSTDLDADFQAAVKLHQEGRLKDAAAAYLHLLERDSHFAPALINLGQLARRMGEREQARGYYQRAADLPGAGHAVWFNLGNLQLEDKDYAAAESSYRRVLEIEPEFAAAQYQLGCVFRDQGKFGRAREHFERAVSIDPSMAQGHMGLGNALRNLGLLTEAIASHRHALELAPDSWEVHYNLARALDEAGEDAASEWQLQEALGLAPEKWRVHHKFAEALAGRGQFDRAEKQFHAALVDAPDRLQSRLGLGGVFMATGRRDEALAAFAAVSKGAADDAVLLAALATVQWRYKLWHEAVGVLRRIEQRRPDEVDSHVNLARALSHIWEIEAAMAECDRALALDPACRAAMHLRGVNLAKQGRVDDALATYEQAENLATEDEDAQASFLFSSLYSDTLAPDDVAKLHRDRMRAWAEEAPPVTAYSNAAEPDRQLRVGYLSPDFKGRHPVAIFLEPILAAHDPARIETYCYASVDAVDDTTAKVQGMCGHWRDVYGWHDQRLAEQIKQDQIDILVDLAGHTAGSRLKALRHRPAPVQACMIGYPHSTGLDAIDYFIADAIVAPPEHDHLYSETVLRVDGCVFCFAPSDEWPAVDVEAARARPEITFGSFNHVPKLTPTTVSVWAKILTEIPGSRLKLKAAPFTDTAIRARYWTLFEEQGIGRDRIEIAGPSELHEMMGEYNDIDIGLDPIPFNGSTTTYQALWMGVPVVTLRGGNFCSRMGASVLSSVGLQELIAETPEDYVDIAVGLARDRDRVLALRAGMRERVASSRACDVAAYMSNLEDLYRDMWRRWCDKRAGGG